MVEVKIKDGQGKGRWAKVTTRGQLVTSPLEFSSPYTATASVNDTAANVVTPEVSKRFVITDILLDADRNVSPTTPATVELYEATSSTETTVDKAILTFEMVKNTNRIITGINLIVTEGRWVNIKTDDNSVAITILGYYVSA